MDVTAMLNDIKAHFEQGEELLASHVPALVDLAGKIEADPLVQTAINLVVPDSTKAMLVSLLKSVEAEFQKIEADAAAKAAAPAEPEPAAPEMAQDAEPEPAPA